MDPQVLSPLKAAEGEQVVPRRQKTKVDLLGTHKMVGAFPAAGAAYQPHPAPGTACAAEHPQGAQGVLLCKAQVLFRLSIAPQAEGNACVQCGGY